MYRCNGLKSSLSPPLSLKKMIQDLDYELLFTPGEPCSSRLHCSPWWAIANPDTTCSPSWDGPPGRRLLPFSWLPPLGNTPPSAGLQPCLPLLSFSPHSLWGTFHLWFESSESLTCCKVGAMWLQNILEVWDMNRSLLFIVLSLKMITKNRGR